MAFSKITTITKNNNNRHMFYSIIAGCFFIIFVVVASLYANMLIRDLTLSQNSVFGMSINIDIKAALLRYDTVHYLRIAEFGYRETMHRAFLPLYPLLIRYFTNITSINSFYSALVISWAGLCAAVLMLYKWLNLEISNRKLGVSPWLVLGTMAIFPTSFYLALPYTESLFLFFSVATMYFFIREKYITSLIFAALASATRVQGVVLGVFFVVSYVMAKNKDIKQLLPLLGSILGIGSYMIFLHNSTGSAFSFIDAQKSWGRLHGNILSSVTSSFTPSFLWFLPVLIVGLWSIYKYLGRAYFAYSLIFITLPLASGKLDSLNRYMICLAPIFLGLVVFAKAKVPHGIVLFYLFTSVFLLAWSLLLYSNGYWVA